MFGRGLDRIEGPFMWDIITVWFCLMANATYFVGVGRGVGAYTDRCIRLNVCYALNSSL